MTKRLLLSFALAISGVALPPVVVPSAATAAQAGVIMTSHRYVYFDPIYGTGWVTDYWDYEWPGFYNYLYTVSGYW